MSRKGYIQEPGPETLSVSLSLNPEEVHPFSISMTGLVGIESSIVDGLFGWPICVFCGDCSELSGTQVLPAMFHYSE